MPSPKHSSKYIPDAIIRDTCTCINKFHGSKCKKWPTYHNSGSSQWSQLGAGAAPPLMKYDTPEGDGDGVEEGVLLRVTVGERVGV